MPLLVGGERPKSSVSFPEKEARRLVGDDGEDGGEFSLDMIEWCVKTVEVTVSFDGWKNPSRDE